MCIGKCPHSSLRLFLIAPKSGKTLKTRENCDFCPIFGDKLIKSTMKSQTRHFSLSPVDRGVFSVCLAKIYMCRVLDFIFQFTSLSISPKNGLKWRLFEFLVFFPLFGALKIHEKRQLDIFQCTFGTVVSHKLITVNGAKMTLFASFEGVADPYKMRRTHWGAPGTAHTHSQRGADGQRCRTFSLKCVAPGTAHTHSQRGAPSAAQMGSGAVPIGAFWLAVLG